MPGMPITLDLDQRRCLIVGGKQVAHRRALALLEAHAQVHLVAQNIDPVVRQLPITCHCRAYQPDDLDAAILVIVATDNPTLNQQIADDARQRNVLVNRADQANLGDFTVPAHVRHGPVTLAVDTDGISPAAAVAIRQACCDQLDPDWPRLLEEVAPYRAQIQQHFKDSATRRDRLRQMTDAPAMRILKQFGNKALQAHCDSLLKAST